MILVDSSVWIANLRRTGSVAVRKLHAIDLSRERIIVGDLILMEVLMGARDEATATAIHEDMRTFEIVSLASPDLVADAARNYRILRRLGPRCAPASTC